MVQLIGMHAQPSILFIRKMTMAIHRFIFQAGRKPRLFENALIASGEAIRSGWRDSQEEIFAQSSKEIRI